MTHLLILAHAPLATALAAVARHIYADCASRLQCLDVTDEMSPELAHEHAVALLAALGAGEILILTDVFGATPCNVAQRLADGARIKVVAGVNVPMLWRTLCYSEETLDTLVGRAMAGAVQGVLQVTPTRPQQQTRSASELDAQGQRHDQQ